MFWITIDDTVSLTLEEDDTVSDRTDDTVHVVGQEIKDADTGVITWPTPEGPKAPMVTSAVDLTARNGSSIVGPAISSVPLS